MKILERRLYVPKHNRLDSNISLCMSVIKIVTGAQIPLSQLRNDAVDNLLGALSIAGQYIIPGKLKFLAMNERGNTEQRIDYRMLPILQPYLIPRQSCVEDFISRSQRLHEPEFRSSRQRSVCSPRLAL